MIAAAPTTKTPRFDVRRLLEVLALAAVYFLTARLGLLLAIPGGHVTPVWPPSGIALAAILLRGRRVWPGIWLGSFAANLWDFYGSPMSLATELGTSAMFGVGAILPALLGSQLLQRFVGERNPMERVRDVCAFMALGGVVSCLVSATVGVTTLCVAGFAPWSDFGQTWLTWWLGDTAGVFVVAPLLLVWSGVRLPTSAARWLELGGCFGLAVVVTYYVFIENATMLFTGKPLTFILIPFLVWPAMRFGQRGAVTVVAVIALLAVLGTINGTGPFHVGTRNEALLLLELFLSVAVLTALCMAAMVTEREHAMAAQQQAVDELAARMQERTGAMAQSEARFRTIFEQAPLGIAEGEIASASFIRGNQHYADILGYSLDELRTLTFKDFTHPEDLAKDLAEFQKLAAGEIRTYAMEKRYIRKDGAIIWVNLTVSSLSPPGEKPVNCIAVIDDITARKQVEQRFMAFATLGRRLNAAVDAATAAGIIVNLADELFGWDACKLDIYDAQTDLCQSLQTMDIVDGRRQAVLPAYAAEPPSARMRRVMHEGPMLILRENPLVEVKDVRPFGDVDRPSASLMFVPVLEGRTVIGVLSIQSYRANAYTQADLTALQDLADHCAGALERLRGRDALRATEANYRTLIESASDGIMVSDAQGHFQDVNAAGCRMLGYAREELLKMTNADIVADGEMTRIALETECLNTGEVVQSEWKCRRKDGTLFPVEVSATVLPGGRMLGIMRNITDRKLAEETLHRTEQLYRSAIAVADAVPYEYDYLTRQYQYMSEGIEPLTGYRPEEISTTLWRQIVRETIMLGEAAGMTKDAAIQAALRGEIRHWRADLCIRTRAGDTRWLSDVSVQKLDAAGQIVGSMGILQDITERKLAEQKLRESQEQLRALLARLQKAQEEERIRVAREIHDELGQLLTGLKMDVRWLERKLTGSDLPPALKPLLDRAVGASELADQTIAVVQKIAAELRPGALDRLGLSAALTQNARRFQERTGTSCQVAVTESGPALAAETASELYYICQEALTNVTRHAQATEVKIRFETSAAGSVLEVCDNGGGIAEADFLAPQSLGLLGMRERVSHCGGSIVWQRCEPQGTRVTVRIPSGGANLKSGETA